MESLDQTIQNKLKHSAGNSTNKPSIESVDQLAVELIRECNNPDFKQ